MPAPLGNQFWKLRSKHGRDILFSSPELLWEAACEYFQWCDDNPFKKQEAKVVSGGYKEAGSVEIVETDSMRPYTIEGLCLYLGCGTSYFRNFQPPNEDFKAVVTRIQETIYTQKFSGAAAGFFNANIIARDLGLADKKEVDKKTTKVKFTDAAG